MTALFVFIFNKIQQTVLETVRLPGTGLRHQIRMFCYKLRQRFAEASENWEAS